MPALEQEDLGAPLVERPRLNILAVSLRRRPKHRSPKQHLQRQIAQVHLILATDAHSPAQSF